MPPFVIWFVSTETSRRSLVLATFIVDRCFDCVLVRRRLRCAFRACTSEVGFNLLLLGPIISQNNSTGIDQVSYMTAHITFVLHSGNFMSYVPMFSLVKPSARFLYCSCQMWEQDICLQINMLESLCGTHVSHACTFSARNLSMDR